MLPSEKKFVLFLYAKSAYELRELLTLSHKLPIGVRSDGEGATVTIIA